MTIPNRLRKAIGAAALILPLLTVAVPASAISIVPECARTQGETAADLNCVLQTFENVANLILGITGSFALLMFVYGGFTMLSSGGSEEKVTTGKTILRNAIIGILIIMLAGYVIRYAMESIRGRGSLTAAGKVCGVADAEGRVPKEYALPDGTTACASSCGQIPGHSCTSDIAGKNCLIGLCEGTQNNRCCPN